MRRLIIVFLLVGLSQLLSISSTPMIGYIKNEDLVDMCGCAFEHRTSTRGYTFAADAGGEIAWMNIDGEDVKLKLTHSAGSKAHRIGSRYTQTYEAEGVKAVLVMIVNRMCIPYSPECETTGYNVTITVSKDSRRATVKAKGQCGCV
jgi:hypothetical protein